MGLNKILQNPEGFLIPNYCFEKKFSKYLFFGSYILNSGDENTELFFELLSKLSAIVELNHLETNWQLLVPFEQKWKIGGYDKSFYKKDLIKKELTNHSSIQELSVYLESYCTNFDIRNETRGFCFNQIVPIFWLTLEDKIAIYASNHEEIIIIGFDTENDLSEIENYTSFSEFLYESIEDYIQFWSRIVSGRITQDKFNEFKNSFS